MPSTLWERRRIAGLLEEAGCMAVDAALRAACDLKDDGSLVTRADRAVEAHFGRELERTDSGIFMIGEETIGERGAEHVHEALRRVCFVVDPIDGTAPYAHGLPWWGISIGLLVAGRLVDGAVYLPEIHGGEILLSEGEAVLEGRRRGGEWSWRELPPARHDYGPAGLIAIGQEQAKRALTSLANPVQALGSTVVALASLVQGRVAGYLGTLRLWDLAGGLPLVKRHGLGAWRLEGERPIELDLEVSARDYELDPRHPLCFAVKGGLLVCARGQETRLHAAFRYPGDPQR